MFEGMRHLTEEEEQACSKGLESISEPTGVIYDGEEDLPVRISPPLDFKVVNCKYKYIGQLPPKPIREDDYEDDTRISMKPLELRKITCSVKHMGKIPKAPRI